MVDATRHTEGMTTQANLAELSQRAQEGMRAYIDGSGPERTMGTKAAAEALVEARALFRNRDGGPDLLGRSHDYREWVSATLNDANVPGEARTNLQAAIRHHVSPILRERYGDDVAELGLQPGSSVERRKVRRERDAHILNLVTGGAPISDVDDTLLLANVARVAVNRVVADADAPEPVTTEAAAALRRLASAATSAAKRVNTAD